MSQGIPFVEELISTIIQNGIKYLKQNPNIVDSLFAGTSIVNRDRLKSFIANNTIPVVFGWPTNQAKIPAFVITLGSDSEDEEVLGEYLGDDDGTYAYASNTETLRIMYHEGINLVETTKKPLDSVTQIVYNGVTYTNNFDVMDFSRGLVELGFSVSTPVASTLSITYVYRTTGTEVYGSFFNSQFRIEAWSNNGDLTRLLYYVLKWIFLSSRQQLAENGIPVQKISGADLEPLPDYLPEFTWRRGLMLNVSVENAYDSTYDFIQGIKIDPK